MAVAMTSKTRSIVSPLSELTNVGRSLQTPSGPREISAAEVAAATYGVVAGGLFEFMWGSKCGCAEWPRWIDVRFRRC
jgi:hypothetical protein